MNFDQIVYLISTIRDYSYDFITSELEKNNIRGLVPSHGAILFQLFRNKEISMKDLSLKINRDKSTVTTLVDKLIRLGLAEKKDNPQDKRGVLVFITPKGLKLQPIFNEVSAKLINQISIGFSENEKKNVMDALKKVFNNLIHSK